MTTNTTPADLARVAARPKIHFAPQRNWMNDPNGLIFHDGVYHLFFQHNPEGTAWGNMSWGHATSTDLIDWTEHAVALRYDSDAQIFSGSIVSDDTNTSGLGTDGRGPLVALYTAASEGGQAQAVAWSDDGGTTWTKYGVVLDRGTSDFRDPKVFRYENHWVMVTVEAADRQIHLYRSDDLLRWEHLSAFGPQGPTEGIWECPDLFPIGDDWVMALSVNPGHPAGGSGMLYFVGHFDGTSFAAQRWDWLDHGPDYYAGVTFSGLDERVMIGWLNNWIYAHDLPDAPWQGSMALPRALTLRDGRLIQTPAIVPTEASRQVARDVALGAEEWVLPADALQTAVRLQMTIASTAATVALTLESVEEDQAAPSVHLTYSEGELLLERASDAFIDNELFPVTASVLVPEEHRDALDLDIWIDAGSVEIFAAAGSLTLSVLTLADYRRRRLAICARGGEALMTEVRVTELRSSAHDQSENRD
ncbi:glycoside hydrolase family 32 protein [Microbacterium stercoris]|uniref:Glycoside hydrolase family 32 protein n=1 Tax=Microbacterium stercoris TaxID=2820289 RepID=A0A939QL71_9MICO|nr:glycoside hydrolase family 32 protein [Microbacterium stercoris]MBO3662815.1 glycoside hydrolase family 32 protein [Microbacterium stercoris]